MLPLEIEFLWPNTVIEIGLTLGLALITRFAVRRLIDRMVHQATDRSTEHSFLTGNRAGTVDISSAGINTNRSTQRARTLGTVLKSLTDVTLTIIVVLMVLNAINLNIMPAIASAGVLGIAIAFGAQSLVKDLFSGIFLLLEDQYGVGDIVEIGELKGTVRSMGFRVTEIQDFSGEVWYLRNGEITTIGNVSQGYSTSYLSIPVSITEDPRRVLKILRRMVTKMDAEPDWHNKMLEAPVVLGLGSFDTNTANYQIMIKCPANQQWDVEREIRSRALSVLSQASVHTPHQMIGIITAHSAETTEPLERITRRRRISKAARQHRKDELNEHDEPIEQQEPDTAIEATADAHKGAQPAPVPTVDEAPEAASAQINQARDWLHHGANQAVRWVSPSDTGHNLAADETVLLDASAVMDDAEATGSQHSEATSTTALPATPDLPATSDHDELDSAESTARRPAVSPADDETTSQSAINREQQTTDSQSDADKTHHQPPQPKKKKRGWLKN